MKCHFLLLLASQPGSVSSQHAQHGKCVSVCVLAVPLPSGSVVRQGAEETSLATSRSTSTSRCSSGFTYINRRKGLLSLAASSLRPAYQPKHSSESVHMLLQLVYCRTEHCFKHTLPGYTTYKLFRLVPLPDVLLAGQRCLHSKPLKAYANSSTVKP